MAKGKQVIVHAEKPDRYGRLLASVEVEGRDLGSVMVADGMAWHYTKYDHDPALTAAEKKARAAKAGLWRDAAPVPPWEWRATEKDRKRKPVGAGR